MTRFALAIAICSCGVVIQAQPPAVTLASRVLGDGSRSVLVLVAAAIEADEVRIELPAKAAETAVMVNAPAGWQLQRDGKAIRATGPPPAGLLRLRVTIFETPEFARAKVRVRSQGRSAFDDQLVVAAAPPLTGVATAAGFVAFPHVVSAGEAIEASVLDPVKTPADGEWFIAGRAAHSLGSDRLGVTLPDDLLPGSPIRVSYFDAWGERIIDALSLEDTMVRERPATVSPARITGCARDAFLGEAVCVCGDFPEGSRTAIRLGGAPATVLAASRHVLQLRLPDTLSPGDHVISGDPAGGFAEGSAVTVRALRLRASIDTNAMLRGMSTTLRFVMEGTQDPKRLTVVNKTPGIISIPGGNYQELETSGGAVNGVERRVTGTGRGDFVINFRLDASPCPCADEPAQELSSASRPVMVPRRVLATIAVGTPAANLAAAQTIAAANGLAVLEVSPLTSVGASLAVFEITDGLGVLVKAAALATDARIALAQPDFVHDASQGPAEQSLAYGPRMIGADAVQGVARGSGVRVAVIDTGVDTGHAALRARVAEFADITGTGWTPDAHGTLVSGIIAADPADGDTAAGVAPAAQLVAVKACVAVSSRHAAARCWSSTLAKAIDLAVGKNVRVMNLSVGGPEDRLLARMVAAAAHKGIAVVSAAGNDGPTGKPSYPAAFDDVIAVTAVDSDGRLYPRATRGAFVDLAAPGVDILSTGPGGRTQLFSGTSAATAFASGAVALLLQQRASLASADVAGLLRDTARDLGTGGRDAEYGDGLLDVCRAMAKLAPQRLTCR